MNNYASTDTSRGLLKDSYAAEDTLGDALKKKREKLAETKLGLLTEEGKKQNNEEKKG